MCFSVLVYAGEWKAAWVLEAEGTRRGPRGGEGLEQAGPLHGPCLALPGTGGYKPQCKPAGLSYSGQGHTALGAARAQLCRDREMMYVSECGWVCSVGCGLPSTGLKSYREVLNARGTMAIPVARCAEEDQPLDKLTRFRMGNCGH